MSEPLNNHDNAPTPDDLGSGHPLAKVTRYALEALGGAIPFVGGLASATASAWSDADQKRFQETLKAWMKLMERELEEMGKTMAEVAIAIDTSDEKVRQRIESEEFLSLMRKVFRDWSAAESETKRQMVRNLLVNAAMTEICSDDFVRMFAQWIDEYDEAHFKVIRAVYNRRGITRYGIWMQIHGRQVRDDSAEADLFSRLITDLSTGDVIRQVRAVDHNGRFFKKERKASAPGSNPYMKSRLDNEEPYELTKLGDWFVHYTMEGLAPRLGAQSATSGVRLDDPAESAMMI